MRYKYSVVIPHYNSSALLKRMIASIPERPDIQIIVVDDCSRPEEAKALKGITHTNLSILFQDKNRGAGVARNTGLQHAEGQWITFADADDTFADNAFEAFDRHVDESLDYICYFVRAVNDATGADLKRALVSDRAVRAYWKKKSKRNANRFLYRNNVCWNKLVNIKLLRQFDKVFEESRVNNDVMYALLVASVGRRFKIVPEELYMWRENENSLTRKPRTIEREFLFYVQAQKTNGLYKTLGLSRYPFYKSDLLYFLHFTKKRGLKFCLDFFKYKSAHADIVKEAKKAYLWLAPQELKRRGGND